MKCSRCKLDINKKEEDGGCKCCKEHGGHALPKSTHGIDYYDGYYGGYGYYDYARYIKDHYET